MVWRRIMLAFLVLRRIPSALSAWWAAMSAPLLALNLLLAGLSVFFVITIVHGRLAPDSRAPSLTGRALAVAASREHDLGTPRPPRGGAYDVIATRNLFDPNRSDAKNLGATVETLPPTATPRLHGVVIYEDTRHAYLEDPVTKRIVDYKIGDKLAGGQVQRIESDRVVIIRAGGLIEVMLHDATRPSPVVNESPQGINEGPWRRPVHD